MTKTTFKFPDDKDRDRDFRKKKKSNRPKKPYTRKDKYIKSWEDYIDNEEGSSD